jgi:hypothetical protein
LREPRYLLGALAGIGYFYFAIFTRTRGRRIAQTARKGGAAPTALALLGPSAPALAGMGLLVLAAASWTYPIGSGLLSFSQAEKQLLFTAPLSSRQLLGYRLLRSQLAVLLSAVILAILYPGVSGAARLRTAVGIWIFLMTCHLYFAGVTLARSAWDHPSRRWIDRLPFVFTIIAAATVGGAIVWTIIERPIVDLRDAWLTLGWIAQTGLAQIALLPFTAALQPLFAAANTDWLRAVPGAALVLLATVVWVIRAGESLDASFEAIPERRENRWAKKPVVYSARPTGWVLGLTGRPETAFVWKGVAQTMRVVDWRLLLRSVAIVLWLLIVAVVMNRARGLTQLFGVLSIFAMGFTIVMAPQIVRADLRQDLEHLEVLKTWPVKAAAVIRGELLWPASVVTVIAWVFGVLAITFSAEIFEGAGVWRVAGGTAALILTPGLVGAQFTIHNLAALLFPAWVQLGAGRARGVDVVGQRLILLGGTWLMLIVLLLPGAILGGVISFILFGVAGPWVLIPAAFSCLIVVAIELLFATSAMAPMYERLDLTSVERSE